MSSRKPGHTGLRTLRFFKRHFWALVVLSLSAYLRFFNLAAIPGWHSDEGTNLLVARGLMDGSHVYLGVYDTYLLIAKSQLFAALLTVWMSLFGNSLFGLRILTAFFGVLTTAAVMWLGHEAAEGDKRRTSLLAGVIFGALPFTVLFNRIGFSYSLPALLVPLILGGLVRFARKGNQRALLLACWLAGVGFVFELWMFSIFPAIFLLVLLKERSRIIPATIGMAVPGILYFLALYLLDPRIFRFDLAFTLSRVSFSLADQLALIVTNLAILSREFWIPIGVLGLFLLADNENRRTVILFFFVSLVFAARSIGLVGSGMFVFLPFAPVLAVGLARFYLRAWRFLVDFTKNALSEYGLRVRGRLTVQIFSGIFAFFLLGSSWMYSIVELVRLFGGEPVPVIGSVLVDPDDALETAAFVNSALDGDDLVIASPAFAGLVEARVTDFQLTLAAEGLPARHFPTDIPASRFVYDVRLPAAKFIVQDRIWTNWALQNVPGLQDWMARWESWPLVFQAGEFSVFQNPDMLGAQR